MQSVDPDQMLHNVASDQGLHCLPYIQQPALVAHLDAPTGGRGFNPRQGWQHSFMEIDYETFSMVILSLPLIQEEQLSVSGERMCTILVNRLEDKACPVNVWLGKLTALDMTPLGWLGRKTSTQTNNTYSNILDTSTGSKIDIFKF